LKVRTALAQGLTPIVAVGETLDERRAGATDDRVLSQTRAAFDSVPAADLSKVAIAYEPIWAIGTGRSCEPDEANRVMATIRHAIDGLGGTPILYGGSMTAANVASYVKCPDINGGLVGGASLDPRVRSTDRASRVGVILSAVEGYRPVVLCVLDGWDAGMPRTATRSRRQTCHIGGRSSSAIRTRCCARRAKR